MKTLANWVGAGMVLVLLLGAPFSLASAQEENTSEADCRCVGADGNEIENCRCFRTFDPGEFNFRVGPFGSSGARIGITLSTSSGEENARGAFVEGVLEDGPADRAGIQEGDVITHLDGRSLFDPLEDPEAEEDLNLDGSLPTQRLLHMARRLEPGDEVEIRYLRDGEGQSTTVEAEDLADWGGNMVFFGDNWEGDLELQDLEGHLEDLSDNLRSRNWRSFSFHEPEGEGRFRVWTDEDAPDIVLRGLKEGEPSVFSFRPEDRELRIAGGAWMGDHEYFNTCPASEEAENVVILGAPCIGGLRMEPMNPKLGEYFGTSEGVLVADVHPDSKLGLEAGDVILAVGAREVTDPDRLRRILRSYEAEEEITLHIMRQQREMEVTGTLGR